VAMECRDKAAVPPRKLVQARLPFKRLNPVPKDKPDVDSEVKKVKSSPSAFVPSKDPSLDASGASLDDVENDCQLGSDGSFAPKLVNGKGPLDHFIQKNPGGDTSDPGDVPELSRGPGHGLRAGTERGGVDCRAAVTNGAAGGELGRPSGSLRGSPPRGSPPGDSSQGSPPRGSPPGDSSQGSPPRGSPPGDSSQGSPPRGSCDQRCRRAGPGRQGPQGELKDVLFEGKVPVVLLEDILSLKSPQGSLDGGAASGHEALESSHEGDSGLSHSSLSSGSSPDVQLVQAQGSCSPLAASTPARKVPQKFHRSSAEKEKLRLQRDQERADKLQKLQAEREEKGRLKEEAKAAKERAKEEAKKRKEEEKELKERERREKKEKEEKEKAEKLRVKEEKRKERQEALEAKLEEKRKKEEEKRLKEEEKRLNAQKAEITRFFQKPKTPQAPKTLAGSCGKFAPFEIKENMVLAPLSRVALDPDYLEQLDKLLHAQNAEVSFLRDLKCRKPRTTGPTLVSDSSDSVNSDVVVVVESCQTDGVPEREKFGRMKLLQFSENHRPAYWGTWNKRTSLIRARSPWSKDTNLLDYEVDSDEEWEEEEPGESLSHSEEDDEEEGEDEDEDDGFFVPHGYLSEDEGVTEECDPENQKVRQKLKAKEWDELIAKGKRFHVLQPVKIGCVWERAAKDSSTSTDLKVLQQFTACVLDPPAPEEEQQTQKCSKKRAKDQQILGQLLPLLHGNVHGSKVIIQEFQECCRRGRFGSGPGSPAGPRPPAGEDSGVPSKARLKRLISESSVYEKRPEFRMCWYVHAEVLRSFGQEQLPVPCRWSYVTQPQAPCEGGPPAAQPAAPGPGRKGLGSMSITKFIKRPRRAEQAAETDGFQADTEEDEEDDDCMIVDVQPGKATKQTKHMLSFAGSTASESSGTRAAHQDSSMVSPANPI
ncbi:CAF1A factor, partial [Phainopepla nitens]|nr:CAF1A factor [Phainopepla nitens]